MEQKFCRNCGEALSKGGKRCSKCNTNTNDVEPIIFKYGLAHSADYFISKSFKDELNILSLLEPNLYKLRKYSCIPFYIAGIITTICNIITFNPINPFQKNQKLVLLVILGWVLAAPYLFFLASTAQKGYKRMWNNWRTACISMMIFLSITIPMYYFL